MNLADTANVNSGKVIDFIHGQAWAIVPSALESIQRVLLQCEGDVVSLSRLRASMPLPQHSPDNSSQRGYSVEGGNAIIPIIGPLEKRSSFWQMIFGGSSTQHIKNTIEMALADPSVQGLVLNIDSPGGVVDGVKELVDFIYESRGQKPIVAYVDGSALSAAYWIASAADKIIAPETTNVGSIGVWTSHIDASKLHENLGLKKTYLYAGKYKVAGNEAAPLSGEDRDYLQGFVHKYYTIFVEDVARNRGVGIKKVMRDMADGKIFIGSDALDAGLIDKLGNYKIALKMAGRQASSARSESDFRAFSHTNTFADNEPVWGGVDKTRLPRMAHAEQGKLNEKSTWGFPHHWVRGGKTLDNNGVYTDGEMFLHKGGLSAAWGAANGARSGKQASDAVKSHLRAHRTAAGMNSEWSEPGFLAEVTESFEGKAYFKDWYIVRKSHKQQTKKEEKIMDLKELKETYPELYQAAKQEGVDECKAGDVFVGLVAAVKASESRISALESSNRTLEKQATLAHEKLVGATADHEMNRILVSSSVPERLHPKVKKQVDYRSFVEDGDGFAAGSESFKAFSAAFTAEVADWEKDMSSKGVAGLGVGAGKTDGNTDDEQTRLVEYGKKVAKDYVGNSKT
ncbi:MAG: signal peptide peptidase SppA [Deltaproteobacteria bacterium]|nr:signal peptide peptidase SppA [Deltaproteobacteria bacterium]